MTTRVQRTYKIAELRKLALIGAAKLADLDESMVRRVGDGWPA